MNINRDGDGNYSISIQESGGDFGNQRSGGVRIEAASGDPQQQLVFQAVANLVKAIQESHEKYPTHPAFIVTSLTKDS